MLKIKSNYLFFGFFMFNLILGLIIHQENFVLALNHNTDSLGYYQWLPTFFVDGSFTPSRYVHTLENGNPLSIFSFGIAVLIAPFFLVAHFFAWLFGYTTDGYTLPYAIAVLVAASFYLSIALVILYNEIKRRFPDKNIAFWTISIIYLGTNLFYYSVFEDGMSHVYNFFVFTLLIYAYTQVRLQNFRKYVLLVGLISGLILVIKPYNVFGLIFLIPTSKEEWKILKENIKKYYLYVIGGLIIFGLFMILQISYWHKVSGNYLMFSYGAMGEGFNWSHPELIKVLFSHQNGWLTYSPLLTLGLIGIILQIKKGNKEALKISVILLLAYYVFASWWCWWFGSAFGHRAFIEYYSFLSLPLAYILNLLFSIQNKYIVTFSKVIIMLFIYMNLRLTFIYFPPWDGDYWTWESFFSKVREVWFL